uniref:MADF domain-containing protein n=1 Tax=Trichogramma kaykai TaxID=54128 RepID=A0ABD2WBN4_9HYME
MSSDDDANWDDQLAERFLEQYQRHECLWNPADGSFDDFCARTEALRKIVVQLNNRVTFEECLGLVKRIRKRYEELNDPRDVADRNRENSRWLGIVDTMLQRVVRNEKRRETASCNGRKCNSSSVRPLFRHSIGSSKCKEIPPAPIKLGNSKNPCKIPLGAKKLKKKKQPRDSIKCNKLEREKCSGGDGAATRERAGCGDKNCPGHWSPRWSSYNRESAEEPIGCPGYASHLSRLTRVQNLCQSSEAAAARPDATAAGLPTENFGRRRHPELMPAVPSPPKPRPGCGCRSAATSPTRPSRSRERPSTSTCPRTRPPSACPGCPCLLERPKEPEPCTRSTCPAFKRPCPSKVACPPTQQRPSTSCCPARPKSPPPPASFQCEDRPKVSAKFENGVLEAYSQFKVVFPSSDPGQGRAGKSSQRVQTDRLTSERACAVRSADLRRRSQRSKSRSKSCRRNARCGTEDNYEPPGECIRAMGETGRNRWKIWSFHSLQPTTAAARRTKRRSSSPRASTATSS